MNNFWSNPKEPSGHNSDDPTIDKEDWSAFCSSMIPRYPYFRESEPAVQLVSIKTMGDTSTFQTGGHGFADSNQEYATSHDTMLSTSSTTSNANSPVLGSSFPNDSCYPTLVQAQGLDLPPPALESSLLSSGTDYSSAHYNHKWQSPYPTPEASRSPLLEGGALEPPGISGNIFMVPSVSNLNTPDIARSSYQILEDLILPQPLLTADEGDGRPIVGPSAHHTQRDTLVTQGNVKRRFECPIPHCGKSYTAKHNLQGHINRKHLGKMTFYICEYCGRNFTGSRAHKRHMHNKNACPTSPFARNVVS